MDVEIKKYDPNTKEEPQKYGTTTSYNIPKSDETYFRSMPLNLGAFRRAFNSYRRE